MRYIVAIFLALSLAACGQPSSSAQAAPSGSSPSAVKCDYMRTEYAKAFHAAKKNIGTEIATHQLGLMTGLWRLLETNCNEWKLMGKIMDLDPDIGFRSESKSAPKEVPANQPTPE